jgi:hypothetical protein
VGGDKDPACLRVSEDRSEEESFGFRPNAAHEIVPKTPVSLGHSTSGFSSVPKGLPTSSSELLPFHGLGAVPPDLISYLPKATSRSASTHGAAVGLQNSDGAVRRGLRKQDGIPLA